MAEITTKRISELPAAESVGSTDLFVMEQDGAAKKVAASLFVGSGVVFVTYDTSTFEEIETAYNDGKMVYVQDGNYAYPLTMFDGENAEFSGYTTAGHVTITCANTDEWDKYTVSYMNAVTLAQRGQVLYYNGLNWSAYTLTKSDVGLGNVDNTSDLAKPVSTATQTALNGKVNAVSGKGLSTNDYTTTEKTKLAGIETGANKTTVDSELSTTSANPVRNSVVTNELNTKVSKPSSPTVGDVLTWDGSAWVASAPTGGSSGVLGVAQDSDGYLVLSPVSAVTEEDVIGDGAVTQALDPNVLYHFTGTLTSLTITLNPPQTGQMAWYHFDFTSGATAPTVTIPSTVTMPDSFTVEANKRYEVDILNGYGAVMTWAVS